MARRRKTEEEETEPGRHPLTSSGQSEPGGRRGGFSMTPANRRFLIWSLAATALITVSVSVLYSVEQFLIGNPAFAINGGAGDIGEPTLHVGGSKHSSVSSIEAVFAEDVGRSLYLVPIEERLTTLRTVDWVRGATVSRIWPNRLIVQVEEREPVAFLTMPDSSFGLIDADGVILPPVPDRFELPVLEGISGDAPVEDRREAVGEMLRVTGELGEYISEISEIDVSDRENLAIMQSYEGRMLKLVLGDRNFGVRYNNFLNHVNDIRERLPGASVLDLRLEDRITVME